MSRWPGTLCGLCGSWCDNYWALALRHCGGADALYADDTGCRAACEGLGSGGEAGDAAGDTVQCRLYHLAAAAAEPATHCVHGGADGGGVCVD